MKPAGNSSAAILRQRKKAPARSKAAKDVWVVLSKMQLGDSVLIPYDNPIFSKDPLHRHVHNRIRGIATVLERHHPVSPKRRWRIRKQPYGVRVWRVNLKEESR